MKKLVLFDGEFPPYVNSLGFEVPPRHTVTMAEAVDHLNVALATPVMAVLWTKRTASAGDERVQYATVLPYNHGLVDAYARIEAKMNDNDRSGQRPLR